jgi:hypothetical protein
MMSDQTAIHFTHPTCHKMDRKCTISGKVKSKSRDKLLKLSRASVLAVLRVIGGRKIKVGLGSILLSFRSV